MAPWPTDLANPPADLVPTEVEKVLPAAGTLTSTAIAT